MKRSTALAFVAAISLAAPAAAQAKRPSGIVQADRVTVNGHVLKFEVPTAGDPAVSAMGEYPSFGYDGEGGNNYFRYYVTDGFGTPSGIYELFTFTYVGSAKYVLSGFQTNSPSFRTAAGTRVGMTYSQAKARERVKLSPGGCIGAGFVHRRTTPFRSSLIVTDPGPGHWVTSLISMAWNTQPC